MLQEVQKWIDRLDLQPHPEGGFFKETYRSELELAAEDMGMSASGSRNLCTGIYYLLSGEDFSALHRIQSDEMWHFYAGAALRVEGIHPDGTRQDWVLHNSPTLGSPQAIVPAGTWFGSRLVDPQGFALVGCTVSPGFDFADFEMGSRQDLMAVFPEHRAWIQSLTRAT